MSDRKYNITKAEAHRLYKTMKDIHDILWVDNKISYWVTGGSLIGALRHRGLVPWDDDGDICIMRSDVDKLRKLVPTFERRGYIIEEGTEDEENERDAPCVTRGKRNSCTWYIEPESKHSLGVDIFVMERIGPIITYSDPEWRTARNGGKSCWFWYKYTFPLLPVVFGNFWVMTPFNAVEHLNQCYGPDWASMSQRLYDHRAGKWIDSRKKRMSMEDYMTIPAPKSTCDTSPPDVKTCPRPPRPTKRVAELTRSEVRMIAKAFKISGRGKKSTEALRRAIKKLV